MQQELGATTEQVQEVILARNTELFTVAFCTTRGEIDAHTSIQRVLGLTNHFGFMFSFQWGETMRNGANHFLTIPYEEVRVATCPIRAVGEQWIAVGTHARWDVTKGNLFPHITAGPDRIPARG